MGPELRISEEIHATKYRLKDETFREATARIAGALKDGDDHYRAFKEILRDMRFLPGGRVQAAMGAPRIVTAFNCFVSGAVEDDSNVIMHRAKEAFETMRRGGGIGYDFSRLRPRGARIASLDSQASGPVSFMGIYDAVCRTIMSAGHRRGAQMGVLRIDHPDISEFIHAKQNDHALTAFNVSVGVSDAFMAALLGGDKTFPLTFNGQTYSHVNPQTLWEQIMRSTWDWAEPGVLFLDTINRMNNLWYCENIEASNPCAEQVLPPYGACLLGSFNLTRYVNIQDGIFDIWSLWRDIPHVVRAMDNVIDRTVYPLPEQEREAKAKRRIGLGVTGAANAGEALGYKYGSPEFNRWLAWVLENIRDVAYVASVELAKEKGPFPLFDPEKYLQGGFIRTLPEALQEKIGTYGIRNSHLTSIAPTGTISLTANNVSSGIEPPFRLQYDRTINTFDGPRVERVEDYAMREWGVLGVTADGCSAEDHVKVLCTAQRYVDSAISKTCNVGEKTTFDDFSQLYTNAYIGGAKGITTFRAAGKRYGILNEVKDEDDGSVKACFIDPDTGTRTCE